MARFIDELKRTHHCSELRAADEGKEVVLFGWVASYRDHGGCVFIDLRDREGITQLVFDPELDGHGSGPRVAHDLARSLRGEWVVGVRGVVKSRGGNKNPKLATGEIEVHVVELSVFNKSETPPFEVIDAIDTSEEKRLEHRYLDLRRAPLQKTLKVRHRISQVTRRYFDDHGFLELETPVMVKYTPGGARNFLVPSRTHAGKFYALAESPQLFKQLYMVAGFDQYFQIVKCFRDEDLRLDRQPEFTQIDVEMSFVNQDDVFRHHRGARLQASGGGAGRRPQEALPVGALSADAVRRVDARLRQRQAGSALRAPPRRPYRRSSSSTAAAGSRSGRPSPTSSRAGEYRRDLPQEIVKGLRVPAQLASTLSRAEIDKLEEFVKGMGAKGLARAKVDGQGQWVQSPLAKTINPAAARGDQRPRSRRKTGTSSSSSSGAKPACRR